ncbi:MAG: DNA polymerase domain-containing protein [bacterium]
MKGFRRIFYNNKTNRIFLWETDDDNKTTKYSIKPDIEYYIPDNSKKSDITDIWGTPVKKQISKSVKDMREFSNTSGINTCETSISEEIKFLQKRYVNEELEVDIDDFQVATLDIELEIDNNPPPFEQMTREAKYKINCLSVHYSKSNEVYTFGIRPYTGKSPFVKNYHYCNDEKTILERFIRHFRKQKVDIITGWNSRNFDIPYIINRCNNLKIELSLSPLNIYIEKKGNAGYHISDGGYTIAGISILDGQDLYKNFVFKKRVSYSLQAIGKLEVNEGKLDYDGQINDLWARDWNGYVEYNVQDVLLTKKIEDKMKHIELTINFCYQALIPFERIFSSISLITGYMMRYLHKKNMVMPDIIRGEIEQYPGAYVMANPGIYNYLMSYDFESLYPKTMIQYNISPETLRYQPDKITDDLIKTAASNLYECDTPSGKFSVDGIYYDKSKKGILAEIVENIFNERKRLKDKSKVKKGLESELTLDDICKNTFMEKDYVKSLFDEIQKEGYTSSYYHSQEQIRKILINSMYGVLGNRFFSFYNIKNAMAITIGARDMITYVSSNINKYMKKNWHKIAHKYFPELKNKNIEPIKNDVVCLCDTDSSYICFDEVIKNCGFKFNNDEEFRQWANKMDKEFLSPFFNKILDIRAKKYNTTNVMNFKREKIITKMMVLAKKKYCVLCIDKEGTIYKEPKLQVTGIEVVRTSTPSFCRDRITDVMKFLLKYEDKLKTLDYLREIYTDFKNANINDITFPRGVSDYDKYANSISKFMKTGLSFKKATPIHIRASICYNYIISLKEMKLQYISNGTKIRFVHIKDNNIIHSNIIGYIGSWPKQFDDLFEIDYDIQWKKSFEDIIQRFFDVFGWGKIKLETNELSNFISF